MSEQILLIVMAILSTVAGGALFGFGCWFGARLTARLFGHEEPIFMDKPAVIQDEDDLEDMQST